MKCHIKHLQPDELAELERRVCSRPPERKRQLNRKMVRDGRRRQDRREIERYGQ